MATPKKRKPQETRSSNEVRTLMLQYFYERNVEATSARGKKGFAVKINDIRKELKAAHGLTQQEVAGNLNYLLSQGWVVEDVVVKNVPLQSGMILAQTTSFFKISAAGIDKIEGPGEFTMDKFKGVRIEATGQNIITVGDGNQVNAKFEDASGALIRLRGAIVESESVPESQKLDAVADIESIQSQLAKGNPNRAVIQGAWEGVKNLSVFVDLASKITEAAKFLGSFL